MEEFKLKVPRLRGEERYDPRQAFLDELDRFIKRTAAAQRFRGQTQAVESLKRIQKLAVFK